MAQPPAYDRTHNFTEELGNQHGINLDQEFDDIETTLDATLANLSLIQRDDGELANQSVHPDALDTSSLLLIASAGGVAHIPRGSQVATNHTSGVFATDAAAGKWVPISGGTAEILDELAGTDSDEGANLIGYQYPATGTTPRTVAGKLDEVGISLRDMPGADPTGVASANAIIALVVRWAHPQGVVAYSMVRQPALSRRATLLVTTRHQ